MALRWGLRLLTFLVVGYCVALLVLVVWQRKMMYFPGASKGSAQAMGLKEAETLLLPTADGQTIVAWYRPAKAGHLVYLYYHGNGGTLADRADLFGKMVADGSGLFAIDYRGYGGSTGSPSEAGLLIDGETAYAKVIASGADPSHLVIVGESLGSAVAVAVAARHPEHALVLDSAFSSADDVAADEYPMFPVRLLMMDSYKSWQRIEAVSAPKLFLQGGKDVVIPLSSARKLYDHAREPKTFILLPDLGHVVLLAPGVFAKVKSWLATLPQG